jgi:glycosyltransferase involved in cell wall biosynthesis
VIRELTGVLRRGSFDVLHCHTPQYLLVVGRVCGRLARLPVVCTYHNVSDAFDPRLRPVERLTRPLSAVSVGVSKAVERTFAGSAELYPRTGRPLDRRTYTVYNGIDVEEFSGRVREADPSEPRREHDVDDGVVFLTIGRYAEEKNQLALIDAMSDVVESLPDARLFVVGHGPLEDDLRRAVTDRGLDENVVITGRVPSVEEYYALADVFVLPSLTEGLSVVLLEAMASGLPIIATDAPGTAEAVVDGETGYVVPLEDRAALVRAMERLGAADRRERFGESGFERVRDTFSIRRTVDSYLDIYRRVSG